MLEICALKVDCNDDSEIQFMLMQIMIIGADDDGVFALFLLFTKEWSGR